MSYGYISSNNDIGIKPVMKIFSRIVHIKQLDKNEFVSYSKKYNTYRKTRVGVLPIGYADGYNRLLSNKGLCLTSVITDDLNACLRTLLVKLQLKTESV